MKDYNIIFEKDNNTLSGFKVLQFDNDDEILSEIPDNFLRIQDAKLPNISENEVIRHFIGLSNKNFGLDTGFYPLGSCTMKYNPKINEKVSKDRLFTSFHPYSDEKRIQGNLKVLYECKKSLLEITGMDDMTLSLCAGAHGELTGLYIIRAYFESINENRTMVLAPDSSHGTNPASANMAGFKTVTVKSNQDGFIDIDDLNLKANDKVAAFMITNPNTLGLFEKNIEKIVDICKKYNIQLYYDGANLNALLGIVRPGDMSFDVVHLNLHKTFSTPHGGGGPGAGTIGVKKHLSHFLPNEDFIFKNDNYSIEKREKDSIGRVRSFYANFLIVLKAYVYIYSLGFDGLGLTGKIALLNANYLAYLLRDYFNISTKDHIMHEFVITLTDICKKNNITIMDFAKRILDYGFHAPTVSFPLIVHDCLMIEPTETESKATLEKFAEVLKRILNEANTHPELLKNAPLTTPVKRTDEVKAAREPYLIYNE